MYFWVTNVSDPILISYFFLCYKKDLCVNDSWRKNESVRCSLLFGLYFYIKTFLSLARCRWFLTFLVLFILLKGDFNANSHKIKATSKKENINSESEENDEEDISRQRRKNKNSGAIELNRLKKRGEYEAHIHKLGLKDHPHDYWAQIAGKNTKVYNAWQKKQAEYAKLDKKNINSISKILGKRKVFVDENCVMNSILVEWNHCSKSATDWIGMSKQIEISFKSILESVPNFGQMSKIKQTIRPNYENPGQLRPLAHEYKHLNSIRYFETVIDNQLIKMYLMKRLIQFPMRGLWYFWFIYYLGYSDVTKRCYLFNESTNK